MMNMLQLLMQFGNIKGKLQQLGVSPSDLQGVDFNDPASLNKLAEKIMPNLLKQNPIIANQIKNVAPQYDPEIVDVIGG